jgi:hypothetical protein
MRMLAILANALLRDQRKMATKNSLTSTDTTEALSTRHVPVVKDT